jgi:phosphoadenosine phosphosulfate reductase
MGVVKTLLNHRPDRRAALPGTGAVDVSALQSLATELGSALAPLSLDERLMRMRADIAGRIVFTTSFGCEDQLILHLLQRHRIAAEVMTLDTGRLFPETYQVWTASEQRYGIRIGAVYPRHDAVEALIAAQGVDGFYESKPARLACCQVRKVEPLERCLDGAAAWITGIRAAQSQARRGVALVEADVERGILKFNPLFDWSHAAVVDATVADRIPVNALHAEGFTSIGCAPCTRALRPGEPERAGRWWWEVDGHSECGLHRRGAPHGAAERADISS